MSEESRAALEAAFEEHDENVVPPEDTPPEDTPPEEPPEDIPPVEDDEDTPPEDTPPEEDEDTPPEEDEDTPPEDDIKAPINWGAEAREEWGNVPASVKQTIVDREREIATTMQNTVEARRTHDHVANLGNKFASVLAAEGAESPLQAVEHLLTTVAQLQMGNSAQKAQRMASLISHYNIDIGALDQALVGETPEVSQEDQIQQGVMAVLNQMGIDPNNPAPPQGGQGPSQEDVNSQIAEFAKDNEFLMDVREDMADLFEIATKQGKTLTLKEAYDKAVAMNEGVQKVIANRKSQEIRKNKDLASKKKAASSVTGKKSGSGGGDNKELSRGDELRKAWDNAS